MSSDEEGLDPQERLEKAQRKEKKELQAKVQALKNSIPKGDKKKKKEVTAEIARLESDLDQKHSAEMLDLLTDNMSLSEEQEEPTNNTNCDNTVKMPDDKNNEPRVSKAQKRREKKAEREKQRLEDIERQEAENLCGQRHLEQEAITRLLEARGLTLHQIPSDGDCMFAGLAHQLSLSGVTSSVSELRQQTATELRTNSGQYLPFLSLSPGQFEAYCTKMASTPEWGGQVELLALSSVLQRPIEVIQAEGAPVVVGEQLTASRLLLTYHRHAYGLGEHYNSVRPK